MQEDLKTTRKELYYKALDGLKQMAFSDSDIGTIEELEKFMTFSIELCSNIMAFSIGMCLQNLKEEDQEIFINEILKHLTDDIKHWTEIDKNGAKDNNLN